MNLENHVNYLVSLVNEKGEMVITDSLRARVSITLVSESDEATELFKKLVNEKLQGTIQ